MTPHALFCPYSMVYPNPDVQTHVSNVLIDIGLRAVCNPAHDESPDPHHLQRNPLHLPLARQPTSRHLPIHQHRRVLLLLQPKLLHLPLVEALLARRLQPKHPQALPMGASVVPRPPLPNPNASASCWPCLNIAPRLIKSALYMCSCEAVMGLMRLTPIPTL